MTGGLRGHDAGEPGDDGRCRECESAIAQGPCAACEQMICADCGVFSKDPVATRVICLSCARLIADVRARAPARPPASPMLWLVVALVAIAAIVVSLALGGCGAAEPKPNGASPEDTADTTTATTATNTAAAAVASTNAANASARASGPGPWLRVVEPPGGPGGLPADAGDDHDAAPIVAARVFAFADTQIHYLYGKRTFAQSPFADRMSFELAVRPAALDDGSDLLLAVFLDAWRRAYADHALVFLGDAADVSCRQELDAFTAVVRAAGADALLAIASNHDGFFVGNFTSKRDLDGTLVLTDMPHDWTRACAEPGSMADHRLTKGRAVAGLAALLPAPPSPPTPSSGPGAPITQAEAGPGGPTDYRDAYLYYVRPLGGGDPGAPPVWGVFLDTVDYRGFDFEGSRGAGRDGHISRAQLRFLDRAMFEVRTQTNAPVTFVAFGHHPVDELAGASRRALREFFDHRPEIAGYVTAHTHVSAERTLTLPSGRQIPELIVGSTTDPPQAARLIEVQVSGADLAGRRGIAAARQPRVGLASRRLMLDAGEQCADVAAQPADALGYTGYRILRDDTPDLNLGLIDKLSFGLGLSNLARQRAVQTLGAIVVENELVRSLARLYLDAPIQRDTAAESALAQITEHRYAAGDSVAALRPWLQGRRRPKALTDYDAWHDPAIARAIAAAAGGLHRFGPHAALFRGLRGRRDANADARRYFLCHAVHAAAAEARHPRRRRDILYIR